MNPTIQQAGSAWLASVQASRRSKTFETYRCALKFLYATLSRRGQNPAKTPASALNEKAFTAMIDDFHHDPGKYSVATELLYIADARQFFIYLVAEDLANVNMEKIKNLVHQRARRAGRRLPEFPEKDISAVVAWVDKRMPIAPDGMARLRDLRDRALVLALADSGLRIHEACNLLYKEIDFENGTAEIIGKGDKQAIVYFSQRALLAIQRYLNERRKAGGSSNTLLMDQPIFARHDKAIGKKLSGIKTGTGRSIIERIVGMTPQVQSNNITPHKFRHFFVTMILNETNDLNTTKELARHSNIEMTTRYVHKSRSSIGDAYRRAIKDK